MSFRSNSLNKVRQDLMQYGPPTRGAIQNAQDDEDRININDSENFYPDQEAYQNAQDDVRSFRGNSLNKVRQDLTQYGPPTRGAIQNAQDDEDQINIDDSENAYPYEEDDTPNLNKFLMKQKYQQDFNY